MWMPSARRSKPEASSWCTPNSRLESRCTRPHYCLRSRRTRKCRSSSRWRVPIPAGMLQCKPSNASLLASCSRLRRLNTFLDLKVENERLQRRLRELTGNAPGALNVSPVVSNRYPPNPGPLPLYTSTSLSVGGYDSDRVRTPVRSSFDGGGGGVNLGPPTSLYSTNTLADHLEEEDGSKKKKVWQIYIS